MVQPDLLELLRCPKCHGKLALRSDDEALVCKPCKLAYPVVEDIPQLLIDEALPLQK